MFKKKQPVDFTAIKRNELSLQVRHAMDMLEGHVRSALARTQLQNILPTNSTEYKKLSQELENAKQDVLEWMTVYTMCVRDLNDYCAKNNLNCPQYVSATQVALTACEYYYKGR